MTAHPELSTIRLNFCPDISDKELELLLSLPLLKELAVTHADSRLRGSSLSCKDAAGPLRNLDLSGCSLVTNFGLECILKKCKQGLKSLKLRQCVELTNQIIVKLPTLCPRLSVLDLSACKAVDGAGLSALAPLDLKTLTLQSLNFPGILPGLRTIVNKCFNLEHVLLSYCTDVSPGDICHVLSSCLSLKHVFMSYCQTGEPTTPWRLQLKSPGLKSLGLRGCSGLEQSSVQDFSSKHRHLEYLDVSRMNITDNQLLQLVSCNPELEMLNLSGCQNISDKSILRLVGLVPRLGEINLKGTRTTNQGILSLCSARYLRVIKCDHLKEDTRQALVDNCPRIQHIQSFVCLETG